MWVYQDNHLCNDYIIPIVIRRAVILWARTTRALAGFRYAECASTIADIFFASCKGYCFELLRLQKLPKVVDFLFWTSKSSQSLTLAQRIIALRKRKQSTQPSHLRVSERFEEQCKVPWSCSYLNEIQMGWPFILQLRFNNFTGSTIRKTKSVHWGIIDDCSIKLSSWSFFRWKEKYNFNIFPSHLSLLLS